MKKSLEPLLINDRLCYKVKQFAALTNRTTQTIYNLIHDGNKVRKLETIMIGDNIYIPATELTDFPFTSPGPHAERNVYHFDNQGEIKT